MTSFPTILDKNDPRHPRYKQKTIVRRTGVVEKHYVE